MFKKLFGNKYSKWILLVLFLLGVALADYFLHNYYNIRGYRGAIVGEKQKGEYRIACFGGSTTYGFGVEESESWPAQLQQQLGAYYTVINLGTNNQGIYGISHDIEYYEDLNFDMAILYQGETDRDPSQLLEYNFRGGDPFFYLFGYKTSLGFYIKNIVLKMTPEHKNESRPVFKNKESNESQQAKVNQHYLDADLIAKEMMKKGQKPYAGYIEKMDKVLYKLCSKKIKTLLVCPPNAFSSIQQYLVRQLIDAKYLGKVEYLNLNDLFPNLNEVSFDGMHLKKEGYEKVADEIKREIFKKNK